MSAKFTKIGNAFFRQDDSGQLTAVTDPETMKGLKAGHLGYTAVENTRGLTFANPGPSAELKNKSIEWATKNRDSLQFGTSGAETPSPNPIVAGNTTSTGEPLDLESMLKEKLTSALTNYKGVTNIAELEGRRQELLRKQLLSPGFEDPKNELTSAQRNNLRDNKGSEYEPLIKGIEEQILGAQNGEKDAIANLANIAKVASDLGLIGGGGFESSMGKEYSDYVKDSVARGETPMSFNEYGNMDANRKKPITNITNSGLSSPVQGRVIQIAGAFDNEPIVKNYSTVASGINFLNTIPNGASAAESQAVIYTFAKIMDPNSAVKEGEYATVQEYAQAVSQKYGLQIERFFTPNSALTAEAIQGMKDVLNNKLKTDYKAYKNLYDEYGRRIDKVTGMNDGTEWITDYSAGYDTSGAVAEGETLRSPDGTKEVNVADLTPDELQEAKDKGWK